MLKQPEKTCFTEPRLSNPESKELFLLENNLLSDI